MLTSTFPRWQGDKEPPFVFELCRRLGDKFDVVVLAPHAHGAERFESVDGIEVVRFRYFFSRWERLAYQGGILANLKRSRWCYLLLPFFFIAQLIALLRILRHRRIDVIHAHWIIPQGLTVAISGLFTKNMPPWICTSHGGDLLGLNGWLLSPIKRWVIRCSSLLTVVSKAVADCALSQGVEPERLHTISMGVDTRKLFAPSPATRRTDNEILFVGRLVEKKGCAHLLDAMPIILERYPDMRLSIVGDGPVENALKQQAARLGIAHAVTFLGSLNNSEISELYRRATVFVAPSIVTAQGDQEGLGLVLVEALACECPVVASDLPAIRDVIVHGTSGWLVPQKNPRAIAGAVVELLAEPGLRRQLAAKGRDYVSRNFDWSIVAARYGALLEKLAGQ
ncbi:glycosyltransferase [Ferrigenium kumadai]|uniref:glycosyltransferase n=1 Tax=Ferrigenium kumadai TaxID=1682490 RepID=UPI001BB3963C|nr:glycosyltransferase [Ferrigenium kumadai]